MKKKLFTLIVAFVCAVTCALGLAACNNGNSAKIDHFYVTDGTNNDFPGATFYNIQIEYGETPDLSKYKLFLHYTNGDTKEIMRNDEKLSVNYYNFTDDDYQKVTALPDDMIKGDYKIEYVFGAKAEQMDENYEYKAAVNISVVQSQSGNFTVQPILTTWQSESTRSKVIVRNPKGAEVRNEWVDDGNGGSSPKPIEKTNDTEGHYTLYLFEKSVYDGFTEVQKKDYQFLYDYWADDNNNENEHKVYAYFNEDDNWISATAGKYMLLALVDETYNYDNIVTPAVEITVKDAIIERVFTFRNMVLQDNDGNVLNDENNEDYGEYVTMAENLNTSNVGKTVIFKANGEVRGSVDFGGGAPDDFSGENICKYLINGTNVTIGTGSNDALSVLGDGVLSGNTFTLTISINGIYKFVITFTV